MEQQKRLNKKGKAVKNQKRRVEREQFKAIQKDRGVINLTGAKGTITGAGALFEEKKPLISPDDISI